ncbi:hemolysin family protein, partial [bacterium]|nr:hemolysin family protein [bacterium]
LAEVAEEHGVLEEDEREMIHSIFEFVETEVQEVMIPRIDMIVLSDTASVEEAVTLIQEKGHSRIPVFHEDIDHIVGLLYAKDLIGKPLSNGTIASLTREAHFVPEGKLISALLKEFQQENRHMAVVVDEYGGTEGLITLEDVLEEIVGEIQDEYDQEELMFKKLDRGKLLVSARMEVDVFNREIGEELVPTEGDFESLGGFIFHLAGEVPKVDMEYEYQGWKFKIDAMENNRVSSLRITPPDDADILANKTEE